ncbi:hypothetical protein SJAV_26110 [Sulfurisphaera javensis]|uniref:Uncharacterized protein n=1 Tax=Sulfurisphaera javensis TaxID=2049879 RepID=A0AAT9GUV3_9CREN
MRWLILSFILLLSPIITFSQLPAGISAHQGPIYTSSVLGFANITALSVNYSTCLPNGSSLQLNVILEANTPTNTYYFWLQNVASFNGSELFFADNVWNSTLPAANMTQVYGKGGIINGIYVYTFYHMHYSLPLAFYMMINESYNSSGVTVYFNYIIVQNGSNLTPSSIVTFDKVFIPIS